MLYSSILLKLAIQDLCIPITFNNQLRACFLNKKYIITIQTCLTHIVKFISNCKNLLKLFFSGVNVFVPWVFVLQIDQLHKIPKQYFLPGVNVFVQSVFVLQLDQLHRIPKLYLFVCREQTGTQPMMKDQICLNIGIYLYQDKKVKFYILWKKMRRKCITI